MIKPMRSIYKFPIIAVLGYKDSGKTMLIEGLTRRLVRLGYRVATAKHVSLKGFTIDSEGKDTWRHSSAGANPVISVSDVEIAIKLRGEAEDLTFNRLSSLIEEADIFMMEGFSWMTLSEEYVGKILCIRSLDELKKFKSRISGEIIAVTSLKPLGDQILKIDGDMDLIAKLTLDYIDKWKRIRRIFNTLPRLDCGRCGFKGCWEMASAIYKGEARTDECVIMRLKPEMKSKIIIDGVEVPVKPFVSEIIRRSVLSMVSTLKGASIEGDENIRIEISKKMK